MWGSEKHILDEPTLVQSIFLNEPHQLESELSACPLPDGANWSDDQRRTLLHAAAFCGNVHITRLLLERGARVNAKDVLWITPLHRVCCREELPTLTTNGDDDGSSNIDATREGAIAHFNAIPQRVGGSYSTSYEGDLEEGCAAPPNRCVMPDGNFVDHSSSRYSLVPSSAVHHQQTLPCNPCSPQQAGLTISHSCFAPIPFTQHQLQHAPAVNTVVPSPFSPPPMLTALSAVNDHLPKSNRLPGVNLQYYTKPENGANTNCVQLSCSRDNDDFSTLHTARAEFNVSVHDDATDLHTSNNLPESCPTLSAVAGEEERDTERTERNESSLVGLVRCNSFSFHSGSPVSALQALSSNGAAPSFTRFAKNLVSGYSTLNSVAEADTNVPSTGLGCGDDETDEGLAPNFGDTCRALLEAGADVSARDKLWQTPLHVAAANNALTCVQVILAHQRRRRLEHSASTSQNNVNSISSLGAVTDAWETSFVDGKNTKSDTNHTGREGTLSSVTPAVYSCVGNENSIRKDATVSRVAIESRSLSSCSLNNGIGGKFNFLDISDKFGRTCVHHAVFNGHVQMTRVLLEHGASPDILDKKQRRPVHYAAFLGHADLIRMLAAYGAQLEVFDFERMTPLHAACAGGRLAAVQALLELESAVDGNPSFEGAGYPQSGARLNVPDSRGNTALHICSLNGKAEVASCLIAAGAPVSARNTFGYTPLHYAAASTHGGTCVELLLAVGAAVNARSNFGRTPLHMSAIHGRVTRALLLINAGASLNIADRYGLTALHIAARYGHELLVQSLLDRGAQADHTASDGSSALHLAALYGHSAVCHKLLAAGADILCRDNQGRTAIHCAAFAGNLELLSDFYNYLGGQKMGSNSDLAFDVIVDSNGRTPLHYAVSNKHQHRDVNLLAYLSQRFPLDAGRPDVDGRTPLHLACALQDDLYVHFFLKLLNANDWCRLLDHSAAGPLHYAAYAGNDLALKAMMAGLSTEEVQAIVGQPPWASSQRLTPIELAARGGHLECLRLLLRCDSTDLIRDVDSEDASEKWDNDEGVTALPLKRQCASAVVSLQSNCPATGIRLDQSLIIAARHNREDCLLYLLKSGLYDVNVTDIRGRTPLMHAACRSSAHTMRALLQYGADPYRIDKRGLTVLHYAFNNSEATRELLHAGATILQNQLDSSLAAFQNDSSANNCYQNPKPYKSPLHLAALSGNSVVLMLLAAALQSELEKQQLSQILDSEHSVTEGQHQSTLQLQEKSQQRKSSPRLHLFTHDDCCSRIDETEEQDRLLSVVAEATLDKPATDHPFVAKPHGKIDCASAAAGERDCALQPQSILSLRDSDGYSVLHYACYSGNRECVVLLLRLAEEEKQRWAKFKKITSHSAKMVNSNQNRYAGPTSAAAQHPCQRQMSFQQMRHFSQTRAHFTELHCAAGHVNGVSVLEWLVRVLGEDTVHARDALGRTPLHVAALRGIARNCDELLARGAHVNSRDYRAATPLMLAAHYGHCSVIETLLNRGGADVLARDCDGATALHRACLSHQEAAIQLLLLERPFSLLPNGDYCQRGNQLQQQRQVLGASTGETDLFTTKINGYSAVAGSISSSPTANVGYPCDINNETSSNLVIHTLVNISDNDGRTPLHLAARNGLVSATQLLILNGADVNVKDRFGNTPALCCATNSQVARCLKLILDVSSLKFAGSMTNTGLVAPCPDMPSPPLSEEEEESLSH